MTLLERLLPELVMLDQGLKGSVPKHMGMQAQWRFWASLALATTPLTEGSPPSDSALSITTVTATVQQYGAWVKLSDLFVHQGIDSTWTETSALLGENAGQTIHTVLINVLAGGTNVRYASTATSRGQVSASMPLTSTEIRKATRALRRAKVKPYPDGFFHGLIHPDTEYDIISDADWESPAQYGAGMAKAGGPDIIRAEVGAIHGVRFMTSTDAPVFSGEGLTGADVYGTLIFGPAWFGVRDLAAQPMPRQASGQPSRNSVSLHTVPIETDTKDDPLGQRGYVGASTYMAAVRLNEQFMAVVEVACSSL
jgi:N4-gp56 family major capsid protein